ncbi:class I SAM-dependent methyltransferase [Saccharibacillus sp. CPCC 101409]|uniref:class I SAM-dependent methyltransferase n=1 Tax=Saccharibacillus sp. CPCC 101409 TaxID=3058041 RepID=UPI00267178B1|nr:class I SAM-dependent methyltransferase [Saccharibacillus sp. CPCC 101409]MDO3411236.1 class I SAM-dependent methyltransferase [Saccharibacillus sp. CPCC 101409]
MRTHPKKAEADYHEKFYEETPLFQPGSWLSRPVQIVMDLLERLNLEKVSVLDLGCGVGRNSIPIAQRIQEFGGTVHAVDLLPVAIDKLSAYIGEYNVQGAITVEAADAEYYGIASEAYDYIVVCSCLEHVSNVQAFRAVVERMIRGTQRNGINCVLINTEVKEYDPESGVEQDGLIELNLPTGEALRLLRELYAGWEILIEKHVPQTVHEHKQGKQIEFRGVWVTFAAQRKGAG